MRLSQQLVQSVQFALGPSYRENDYEFKNPALLGSGNFQDQAVGQLPTGDTTGLIDVREVYGELLVPIVVDVDADFNAEIVVVGNNDQIARDDLPADVLLQLVHSGDQFDEIGVSATVSAGYICSVATVLRTGVDQQRTQRIGANGLMVLIVQHGSVLVECHDAGVRQIDIALCSRSTVSDM